jgi:O-antigen ligase
MLLYYLASIAGLFPRLTLPLAIGWKSIQVFDALFAACLVLAISRRSLRPPDWRLIAAGGGVVAAGSLALMIHPSPEGFRVMSSLAYSMLVFLFASHLRLNIVGVSITRLILWPLVVAVGIAWAVFLFENLTQVALAPNQSPMLPAFIHRLGGFTGGNALILFLCLAGPLVRGPWWIILGVVPSAVATMSRSLVGVGVALLLDDRLVKTAPSRLRTARLMVSSFCVALGMVFYALAVISVVPSDHSSFVVSLKPGGYLTPHLAALRMLRDQPLVGVGPGGFADRFRTFTSKEERERLPPLAESRLDPHSAILGLAAEQGLLGLSMFAWLIYEIFRRLSTIESPALRSASRAGLAGLLVGGHFVDWLLLKGLWLWIGIMAASRGPTQSNLSPTSL